MAAATEFDAVVLDVMLPGIDGFATCRRLREDGVWAPIIMVTARDSVDDRVQGLDQGADDYLTKPFSLAELLARLRALARRGPVERPPVLEVGDLRLDPATQQAWRGEEEITLSPKEFALLETFMRRPGELLSRYQLLEHAWDYDYENRSNVVEVYVRYLREKIDRPFGVKSLETVRGAGYRLRRDGGSLSRLPIRVRMTAAFALAMTLLIAAMGVFVYERQESNLDEIVNTSLRSRSDDVAALVRSSDSSRSVVGGPRLVESDEGFIQILTRQRAIAGRNDQGPRAVAASRTRRGRPRASPWCSSARLPGSTGRRGSSRARRRSQGQNRGGRHRRLAGRPRRHALDPVEVVPDRRADRRAARLGHRLHARDDRLPAGGGDAPAREADLPDPRRASACRCPTRTTRSAGWGRRSTRCSRGWRARSSASGSSSRTRATSCARRWRS